MTSALGRKPHLSRPAEVSDLKWDGVGVLGAFGTLVKGQLVTGVDGLFLRGLRGYRIPLPCFSVIFCSHQ